MITICRILFLYFYLRSCKMSSSPPPPQRIRFLLLTLVTQPTHISDPNVCEREKEAPSDCSPSVSAPGRGGETDVGPRSTPSRKRNREEGVSPASSLCNIKFWPKDASINGGPVMFSAHKFAVIPAFPLLRV